MLCSAVGRDLYAYLSVMVNHKLEAALNRIRARPKRGFGDDGWSKMRQDLYTNYSSSASIGSVIFAGLDDVWVDADVIQTARFRSL